MIPLSQLLLLPDLLLQGHSQHLTVQGQELLDGKLLHLSRGGEELVVGIGLLLLGQLVKLIQELLFLIWAKQIEKLLWVTLNWLL